MQKINVVGFWEEFGICVSISLFTHCYISTLGIDQRTIERVCILMLGCKGLIPYISLEQFFFTQLLSGVRESCWDSRSQWTPYHARDIFCGWQDRMQGNTSSVFPLWYLLTQKSYHVKVSFQCVANYWCYTPWSLLTLTIWSCLSFLTHSFPSIIFICGTVPFFYIFVFSLTLITHLYFLIF